MWRRAPESLAEPAAGAAPLRPVAASAPALALRGVSVEYQGAHVLRSLALEIRRGERVAVIGPSGAGKSTLFRLANTSLLPSGGAVRILGQDPVRLPPARLRALRARVGMVWQQLQLVPQASVLENVRMGRVGSSSLARLALGGAAEAERARVAEVLAQVGLEAELDRRLETLSGGEQQRVAVARVLHQSPDLILADEPLASVDPARAEEVLRLLLAAAEGRTLIVATHQLEPVLPFFPRVVGLRSGAVLFDLPRERVGPLELAALYQPLGATRSRERIPRAGASPPERSLRIAASSLPGDHLLPPALGALRAAHPEVRIHLSVTDTGDALARLAAGRADLAVVGARELHPELIFEDLLEDEIVLLASPALPLPPEPLAPGTLSRLPRVDREPGSATRRLAEAQLAEMGVPLDPGAALVEAGSAGALKAAVASGAGVGFASRLGAAAELAAGRLRVVAVARLRIPRRVFAALRRGGALSPAAAHLLALVRRPEPGK